MRESRYDGAAEIKTGRVSMWSEKEVNLYNYRTLVVNLSTSVVMTRSPGPPFIAADSSGLSAKILVKR